MEKAIVTEEAEGPIDYSQKHAHPSELEDCNTLTPRMDVEQAQAKTNQATVTLKVLTTSAYMT